MQMATESLSSVVIDMLETNRTTGKSAIEVYRSGVTRIAKGVESVIEAGAGRINKKLQGNIAKRTRRLTGLVTDRVAKVSDGAGKALDRVYDGFANAVHTVSKRVDSIDNGYATRYFDYVGKAALPSVKLTRDVTTRIADGVDSVYSRLTPPKAKTGARKVRRAPAKRSRARSGAAAKKA
jgi:phage-related protein